MSDLISSYTTMPHQPMDYVAAAEMMWYSGEWQPRFTVFASVDDLDETYAIETRTSSLDSFTFDDVYRNLALPIVPWESIHWEPSRGKIQVPLEEVTNYIRILLYQRVFTSKSNDGLTHIGTMDMDTYHYLSSFLPLGAVHFIGCQCLANDAELLGSKPYAGPMVLRAAENLHSL